MKIHNFYFVTRTYSEVFMTGNGDRAGVDNVIVLVSDGGSNVNPNQTIPGKVNQTIPGKVDKTRTRDLLFAG
jgi:hypothetical protein